MSVGKTAVITETVPKYIPKNIDSLAVSRTDQYLIGLSSDDPDALYIYQFFWEASGGSLTNRQNAWSKWTFPNKSLYWCDFIEGTLFSVAKYTENSQTRYYLEALNASRPPQESKPYFDKGTASHIAILEPEKFKKLVIRGGKDRRQKEYKEAIANKTSEQVVLPDGDYEDVLRIKDAVSNSTQVNKLL